MKQILKEFVRAVIAEAAVSVQDATSRGLALIVKAEGAAEVIIVVYDPSVLLDGLTNVAKIWRTMDLGDWNVAIHRCYTKSILGTISLMKPDSPCNDAWTVTTSAAEPKHGPLLYDIAMSVAPGPVMSDRETVSSKARAVWAKYAQRPDVQKLPLDDEEDPKTPPKEDDCQVYANGDHSDPRNSAYKLKSPHNVKELRLNHARAMHSAKKLLGQMGADPADSEDMFGTTSRHYFVHKFQTMSVGVDEYGESYVK